MLNDGRRRRVRDVFESDAEAGRKTLPGDAVRERYFDPKVGRFISQDPKPPTMEDLANLYRYAWNDPINRFDPTGFGAFKAMAGMIGSTFGGSIGGPTGGIGSIIGGAIDGALGGGATTQIQGGGSMSPTGSTAAPSAPGWSTLSAEEQRRHGNDPRIYAAVLTGDSNLVNEAWFNSTSQTVHTMRADFNAGHDAQRTLQGRLGQGIKDRSRILGGMAYGAWEGVTYIPGHLDSARDAIGHSVKEVVVAGGYGTGLMSERTLQAESGLYAYATNHYAGGGGTLSMGPAFGKDVAIGLEESVKGFYRDVTSGDANRASKAWSGLAINSFAAALTPSRAMSLDVGVTTGGFGSNLGNVKIKFISKIDRVAFKVDREAFWKKEAVRNPTQYKPEDLMRMRQGKPPIGPDGHPVELHHVNQTPNGGVVPMTRTDHRLGENYKKNHPNQSD